MSHAGHFAFFTKEVVPDSPGWLFALGADADSEWGSVERFYDDVSSSGSEEAILLETDTWGKTLRKGMRLREGDGIAFYHTSRAIFPADDKFHRRARISAIGRIEGVEQEGQEVTWLRVSIDRSVLERMRTHPLVWTEETAPMFRTAIRPGAIATFYEVPGPRWNEILQRAEGLTAKPEFPITIESIAAELNRRAVNRPKVRVG